MDQLPTSLLDILCNTIILRHVAPFLPVSSICALASTNKSYRQLVYTQSEIWRRLDLTRVKSAIINSGPIDIGGTSWRAERMDEALTEDDFYAGPLRGILGRLQRSNVLEHVQILLLDGLSVPADFVREIICEDRSHVRVLSIRECKNLNQSKLQQVLRYAVRPTRISGTPRLRALYFFGRRDIPRLAVTSEQASGDQDGGITRAEGAQIGSHWNSLSSALLTSTLAADDQAKWYGRSGRLMTRPQSDWPDTLQACKGVIAFDAVLCRGPLHDITKVSSTKFLPAAIATVALGPHGCEMCGSCPEGPVVFGQSHSFALPLLAPPPSRSSTVRAAQRPETVNGISPPLHVRCEACLRGRWCERCNRFWCESCYTEPIPRMPTEPSAVANIQQRNDSGFHAPGASIKIGVYRDCFDCGRTCAECSDRLMRTCTCCEGGYCRFDDVGSTDEVCSWCARSGSRIRQLALMRVDLEESGSLTY